MIKKGRFIVKSMEIKIKDKNGFLPKEWKIKDKNGFLSREW